MLLHLTRVNGKNSTKVNTMHPTIRRSQCHVLQELWAVAPLRTQSEVQIPSQVLPEPSTASLILKAQSLGRDFLLGQITNPLRSCFALVSRNELSTVKSSHLAMGKTHDTLKNIRTPRISRDYPKLSAGHRLPATPKACRQPFLGH